MLLLGLGGRRVITLQPPGPQSHKVRRYIIVKLPSCSLRSWLWFVLALANVGEKACGVERLDWTGRGILRFAN